jgi:hypothetical protein
MAAIAIKPAKPARGTRCGATGIVIAAAACRIRVKERIIEPDHGIFSFSMPGVSRTQSLNYEF